MSPKPNSTFDNGKDCAAGERQKRHNSCQRKKWRNEMFEEKLTNVLGRGLAVWVLIMVAGRIHGTLRRLILQPLVGDLRQGRSPYLPDPVSYARSRSSSSGG